MDKKRHQKYKKPNTLISGGSFADADLKGKVLEPVTTDSTTNVNQSKKKAKTKSKSKGASATKQDMATIDFVGSATTQENIGKYVVSENAGGYKLFQKSSGKVGGKAKSTSTLLEDADITTNKIKTKVDGKKSALDLEVGGISKSAGKLAHNLVTMSSGAPQAGVKVETETKLKPNTTSSTASLSSEVPPKRYYPEHPQFYLYPNPNTYSYPQYPYSKPQRYLHHRHQPYWI